MIALLAFENVITQMLLLEPNLSWADWLFLIFLINLIPVLFVAVVLGFSFHFLFFKNKKIVNQFSTYLYFTVLTIFCAIAATLIIAKVMTDFFDNISLQ